MNAKLMGLANQVKTRHGYKLAERIAEIARDDGWISVDDAVPSKSGDYKVRYACQSDDTGRFNRGVLGTKYLQYWSDEKYALRVVTHWQLLTPPNKD